MLAARHDDEIHNNIKIIENIKNQTKDNVKKREREKRFKFKLLPKENTLYLETHTELQIFISF